MKDVLLNIGQSTKTIKTCYLLQLKELLKNTIVEMFSFYFSQVGFGW